MGSNPAPVTLDHSTLHSFKLTFVLHLQNLKSLQGYYCKLHSHDLAFTTLVQLDFTFLQQHNLKSLSTVSIYINVHHARTTWILLHSYNLISGFYTCAASHLYLLDQMMCFTLHSHTLIFITTPRFPCFFILVICACFLTSPYFLLTFMSKLSRDPEWSTLEQLFFLRSCEWLLPIN